jgi:hypothetical protein
MAVAMTMATTSVIQYVGLAKCAKDAPTRSNTASSDLRPSRQGATNGSLGHPPQCFTQNSFCSSV